MKIISRFSAGLFLISTLLIWFCQGPCAYGFGSGRTGGSPPEASDRKGITAFPLEALIPEHASPGHTRRQTMEIGEIIDRLSQRLDEYPELTDWKAHVFSVIKKMDKNWRPKKTTSVEKNVIIEDGVRIEEIISALEEEKGKKKDVTEKSRKEAEKEARNARKKAAKGEKQGGRQMELKQEDLFPFDEDHRGYYNFTRLPDELIDQRPVIVVETLSYRKSREYFQGKYYIDPESWNIIKVELKPAKLSGALKTLEMVLTFMEIPEGHLVPKTTWVRLHVGLVVKNIRFESEEVYSGYQVLR